MRTVLMLVVAAWTDINTTDHFERVAKVLRALFALMDCLPGYAEVKEFMRRGYFATMPQASIKGATCVMCAVVTNNAMRGRIEMDDQGEVYQVVGRLTHVWRMFCETFGIPLGVPQALIMKRMREVMYENFTGMSGDAVTEGELRRIHAMKWDFPTVLPEDGGDVGHRLEVPNDMNMPIVLISSVRSGDGATGTEDAAGTEEGATGTEEGAAGTEEGAAGTGADLDDDERAVIETIRHLFENAAARTEADQTSGATGTGATAGTVDGGSSFTPFQGVGKKLSSEPLEQQPIEDSRRVDSYESKHDNFTMKKFGDYLEHMQQFVDVLQETGAELQDLLNERIIELGAIEHEAAETIQQFWRDYQEKKKEKKNDTQTTYHSVDDLNDV
jgi:hypothetical protein